MSAQVSVVDYGLGNLGSILNMFRRVEVEAALISTAEAVVDAERLLLPGVGGFDHGARGLCERGLKDAVQDAARSGTPILGICLGMQLLTNASDEGDLPGLGLIDARCERLAAASGLRVPHMGWNQVRPTHSHPIVDDLPTPAKFYFAHSFRVVCASESDILAHTEYGSDFPSMVVLDNVCGAQFHPEKSHAFGMRLFESFAGWSP